MKISSITSFSPENAIKDSKLGITDAPIPESAPQYVGEEAEVRAKWQELNELSVDTLSAYRDATAQPRSTDRLGKVVKHARGHNQAVNKIAKQTGDHTPNKEYARTVEEGQWVARSLDGVEKRFKDAAQADAWRQTTARPPKAPKQAAPKLTLDAVWNKVEQVVANIFPDGDPIDYLAPWLEKQGIKDFKIGEVLDRAAKKNGYDDIYAYYDSLKKDYGDQQLNELSNELLGKYKKAAGADASKADKEGNYEKGNKRFSGIVKATNKQFDNDKKKAVQEALIDILGEDFGALLKKQHDADQAAKPKARTVEIPYHGWLIRYRPASGPGEQVAWQVMDKKGDVKHKAEAPTDKDAVADAEAWINKGGDAKQAATSNVTIDFNVDFAREFAPDGGELYVAFDRDGETPMLIVSTEMQQGFKKTHPRNQKHKMTATTTALPCATLSAKEANNLGLQANGRYLLGPKDPIDDHTAMFPLIFQGIVQGKGDLVRMGKPGLTVAHNRD